MTDPTSLREDSFGLEALLDDQTLNGTSHPLLPQAESALIGALDQIFVQKRFTGISRSWSDSPPGSSSTTNSLSIHASLYILKLSLDSMWGTAWRGPARFLLPLLPSIWSVCLPICPP